MKKLSFRHSDIHWTIDFDSKTLKGHVVHTLHFWKDATYVVS